MKAMLDIGENVAIEFKRCGNGIESDTYESVCSFLNRFGGDIFMGVENNGKVVGVPVKAASDMIKNFISVISNPALLSPTIYLVPEIIEYESNTIVHVHVPPSAEVHSYKKIIYDRVDDADVKVTATSQIASMYIRKQNIFTEKKIYPYMTLEDLRLDLLPKLRQMAVNHAGGSHPWAHMGDQELLKSAGLYGMDMATGEKGYNLAAVMLLGKDDVILNVCPAYETDALVRKVNIDRYDDREIVRTNLIESYDKLMEFAQKNLPDKFFLEDTDRVSLRNILAREMLGNTLMHREFSNSYAAKFVIEKDKMYVENANRAVREGVITPDNLEPNPKNPIIASFFRNIGRADRLGSGVRNLFKYSKFYSGKEPQFIEGDVFRIIVPLNEAFSYDFGNDSQYYGNRMANSSQKVTRDAVKISDNAGKVPDNTEKVPDNTGKVPDNKKLALQEKMILNYVSENGAITSKQVEQLLDVKQRRARIILSNLVKEGILLKQGNARSTVYVSKIEDLKHIKNQ